VLSPLAHHPPLTSSSSLHPAFSGDQPVPAALVLREALPSDSAVDFSSFPFKFCSNKVIFFNALRFEFSFLKDLVLEFLQKVISISQI